MDDCKQVPYIVYESAQARSERTIKKLIIALIISILLLCISNLIWLREWTQYDYIGNDSDTTVIQDGEGFNTINTGTQGDIEHGADN